MQDPNKLVNLKYKGETPNPKVVKVAQKLTSNSKKKLFGITSEDSEYWGLRGVLDDDMCDIILKIKQRHPYKLDELVKICEVKEEEIGKFKETINKMCHLGLLEYDYGYHYDHNGRYHEPTERRYIMPLFVPGSAELLNMDEDEFGENRRLKDHPELASFFERMTYHPLKGITQLVPPGGSGVGMHVIPVEKAIEMNNESIDIEHLSYWLEKYKDKIAVGQCSCRISRKVLGEGVADDHHAWCIGVGDFSDYLVETEKGKRIDKEEALRILKVAEDNGFVHQITNIDGENKIFGICNCNVNICNALRTSQLFNTPNLSRSSFTASVDKTKCVACGKCTEVCPAGAIKLGQKLCTKEGEVKYPKHILPDHIKWGEEFYDDNYRNTNRIPTYKTGTSPCKSACPSHVSVQGYLRLASQGKYKEALALIKKDNPFPAICGRVCNRKCEEACTRGLIDDAVNIDGVKRFIADLDLNEQTRYIPKVVVSSSQKTSWDEKIAIIGSGPCGLSCAYFLALRGYKPTVFEKSSKLGGMMRYGIPSYKLPKDVLDAEIDVLSKLGVTFRLNCEVGVDTTFEKLRQEGYKGFFVAIGQSKGRMPNIKGVSLNNVTCAIDLLHKIQENNNSLDDIKDNYVVIGGGNVAIDIARSLKRLNAKKVTIVSLEEKDKMPASNVEVLEAIEDNVEMINGYGLNEIVGDGKVESVSLVKCVSLYDDTNKFNPQYDLNETLTLKCDCLVFAIGQTTDIKDMFKDTKVKFNGIYPVSDKLTYQTDEEDIFVGGDFSYGPSFAINAIESGKVASESLHRYVHPNSSLTIGRINENYTMFDKDNLQIESYDTSSRQTEHIENYNSKFDEYTKSLTEEEVKIETKRCLGCGASIVDTNKCLGCGVCTTRCMFDAITLNRTLPEASVMKTAEDKFKGILPYALKRAGKIIFTKKTKEEKLQIKEYKQRYNK